MSMDVTTVFKQYLIKHSLKITPERVRILNEISKINQHFDPDMLLFKLRNKNMKVSRATIYRTLDLLVDCNLVIKNVIGNSNVLYEKKYDTQIHDHFLCMSCGKIIEFYDSDLEKIHKKLAEKYHLSVTDYRHQVFGTCGNCKES